VALLAGFHVLFVRAALRRGAGRILVALFPGLHVLFVRSTLICHDFTFLTVVITMDAFAISLLSSEHSPAIIVPLSQ
jgi:hypothetical protein